MCAGCVSDARVASCATVAGACDHVLVSRDDGDDAVRRPRRRRGTGGRGRRRTGSRERGHRVLVVEKKRFPREKTCGDGLTPRAVRQLARHGPRRPARRVPALRRAALDRPRRHARARVARAPRLPVLRLRGAAPRARRDGRRPRRSRPGATLWPGAEALAPVVEDGLRRRARSVPRKDERRRPRPVRARYVVVADGANSRFGRALGTARDRTYPLGMAIRGYFTSPFHDEPWIESHLDLRDRDGNHLPGLRLDLPGRRRHGERRRRPALDLRGLEGRQHHAPDGRVLRDRAGPLGHLARDRDVRADRRQAARPAAR